MEPEPITISATVPVSASKAWAAFTDPDAIVQWNFASDDWQCPSAKVDLKIGGRHCARMEAKDGSIGFDFEGTYEEVDEPHALTLVLDDGRKARTTFRPSGSATEVTTRFDPDGNAPLDMQRDGWQAILDNYAAYTAARAG